MNPVRVALVALSVLVLVGCGESEDAVMPDVVGEQLDIAKSEIDQAGYGGSVDVEGGGIAGVVIESNWRVCEQSPAAGEPVSATPRLTVERSCAGEDTNENADEGAGETDEPSATTQQPSETTAIAPAYAYDGPAYEVVTIDEGAGLGTLDQYWIFTEALDYSTDAYKDQIKAVITDVARSAGTPKVLVSVVTDRDIALAEAASTYEAFIAEHGVDHAIVEIPKREATGWVASYTGGIDYDTVELSEADSAFEILWFGASDNASYETWKPTT